MSTRDYVEIEERLGAHNYHPLDVVLTRGEGVWVWDVEGNKYLDFLAAYSAVNQGHAHPRLRQVLVEQSARVTLTSRNWPWKAGGVRSSGKPVRVSQ